MKRLTKWNNKLGRAVVPQQFYPIFMAIVEVEKGERDGEINK